MTRTPSFAELIAPYTPQQFFHTWWEQDPLHIPRNDEAFYANVLSVDELDTYLQSQQLPAACVNVVRLGSHVDVNQWTTVESSPTGDVVRVLVPEKALALLGAGATLIVNRAHRAIPNMANFCDALSQEFGFHTRANVYITPPHAQGFPLHYDTHDLCILQINGRKRWRLYDTPVPLPVHTQPFQHTGYTPPAPAHELELQPGDLLYIPRGLVHEADSLDTTSIHISLGLQPHYWFQLIEELATLAQEAPPFRRALPHKFSSDEDISAFRQAFTDQLHAVLEGMEVDDLLARQDARFVQSHLPTRHRRFADLVQVERLTGDACVSRGVSAYTVERTPGTLTITFGEKQVALPAFHAPALETLLQDDPFAVRDLKGLMTLPQKVALVAQLVRAGFLTIVSVA